MSQFKARTVAESATLAAFPLTAVFLARLDSGLTPFQAEAGESQVSRCGDFLPSGRPVTSDDNCGGAP